MLAENKTVLTVHLIGSKLTPGQHGGSSISSSSSLSSRLDVPVLPPPDMGNKPVTGSIAPLLREIPQHLLVITQWDCRGPWEMPSRELEDGMGREKGREGKGGSQGFDSPRLGTLNLGLER